MPRSGIPAYLAKYAEAGEEALLDLDLDLDCSHAICIPACSEDERFLDTLESLRAVEGGDAALVILVVNGAEDSPEAVHDANRLFLEWLRACLRIPSKPIALTRWKGLRILVLDHASSGRRLPAKQGVGLARKIASDLALRWYAKGHIRSPWMCCTDADVELPPDYLTGLPPGDSRYAAVLYPFVHQLEGDA